MDVSKNSGTPKSSILIGFSTINHPFWGFPPMFGNPHIYIYPKSSSQLLAKRPFQLSVEARMADGSFRSIQQELRTSQHPWVGWKNRGFSPHPGRSLEDHLSDRKWLGSPLCISHKKAIWKGNNLTYGDLLTMAINRLVTGMILQVPPETKEGLKKAGLS